MNKIRHIILLLIATTLIYSCKKDVFEDSNYKNDYMNLYMFLESNENYSFYKMIVDAADIEDSEQNMSTVYASFNAQSPEGTNRGYTLFLPDNDAVMSYLADEGTSLEAILADADACWNIAANHLIIRQYSSRYFPNGTFGDSSLNGYYHAIRYLSIEEGSGYLLDEAANVIEADYYLSNGVIHFINQVLTPISYTSCEWLEGESEYSIFTQALKATSLYDVLQNTNTKTDPYTMFVEADSVFGKYDIYSFNDLTKYLQSTDDNYSQPDNELYQFMAYHVLPQSLSLNDMSQTTSSYTDEDGNEIIETDKTSRRTYDTYAYNPLQVTIENGLSNNGGYVDKLGINAQHFNYDTIVSADGDTSFIDYISLYESSSNKNSLSGVMHFINYPMTIDTFITPSIKYFHFRDDAAILDVFQNISGKRYTFKEDELERFSFSGDLEELGYRWYDEINGANNGDYIFFNGSDFTFTYRTTAVLQGNYKLRIKMRSSASSGFFDMYVDGQKVGNTINIDSKSPNNSGYSTFDVGNVFLEGYKEREVTLKSVTPCTIYWDLIIFQPF